MVRIGIIGAAGLSGLELLHLLSRHSEATVNLVTSTKYQGKKVTEVFPELYQYSLTFNSNETDVLDCDVVFLAIPNQASLELVPKLLDQGIRVIDLSGAYRLANIDIFETLGESGRILTINDYVKINTNSLKFECSMDGNSQRKTYPRPTDPYANTQIPVDSVTNNTITVNVGASPNV